jgi:AGCS family alanine or glycine:cation symporter
MMVVAIALVIVGGIESIGKVASRIVPFMCLGYVGCAIYILGSNFSEIPNAFSQIFTQAFNPDAAYGGFLGCMVIGIKRAVFSNEAGAGSASIAHSAAKTEIPVSEGYVALLEPFIDTVVVCTMTALVIIITGVNSDPSRVISSETIRQEFSATGVAIAKMEKMSDAEVTAALIEFNPKYDQKGAFDENNASIGDGKILVEDLVAMDRGAYFTKEAFVSGGHPWFRWFLYVAIVLFAYSTCISWYYYGERCFTALLGEWSSGLFKVLFLSATFVGSVVATSAIKDFSDMLILGMAFPNMLGMYFLSGKVRRELADYLTKLHDGTIAAKE